MQNAPVDPLDVLRHATARADVLERAEDRRFLALAHLVASATFPLTVTVRGLVTGRRDLPEPCLEVLPEGFGASAFTTLGPLLVPTDRALAPGSVVVARVELVPPDRYVVQPAALVARTLHLDIEVAVEA